MPIIHVGFYHSLAVIIKHKIFAENCLHKTVNKLLWKYDENLHIKPGQVYNVCIMTFAHNIVRDKCYADCSKWVKFFGPLEL